LVRASVQVKDLYEQLKERILQLGDIKVKVTKLNIAFIAATNFTDVEVQKKSLKVHLNMKKGELDDPVGLARDVSAIAHWGNGDYEITVDTDTDLDYIMYLIAVYVPH